MSANQTTLILHRRQLQCFSGRSDLYRQSTYSYHPFLEIMITIRPAGEGKIPDIARVAASAFWNHPDVTRWYPKRERYSRCLYFGVSTCYRRAFSRSRSTLLVATKPSNANNGHTACEVIIRFTAWQRYGKSARAREWRVRTFRTRLYATFLMVQNSITIDRSMMGPIDRWKLNCRTKETDETVGDLKLEDSDDHWMLHLLAVTPESQGTGIGAQLLDWGVSRA